MADNKIRKHSNKVTQNRSKNHSKAVLRKQQGSCGPREGRVLQISDLLPAQLCQNYLEGRREERE